MAQNFVFLLLFSKLAHSKQSPESGHPVVENKAGRKSRNDFFDEIKIHRLIATSCSWKAT
jgi:hypothetical protein